MVASICEMATFLQALVDGENRITPIWNPGRGICFLSRHNTDGSVGKGGIKLHKKCKR